MQTSLSRGHATHNEIINQPKKAEYQVWNPKSEVTLYLQTKSIGKTKLRPTDNLVLKNSKYVNDVTKLVNL